MYRSKDNNLLSEKRQELVNSLLVDEHKDIYEFPEGKLHPSLHGTLADEIVNDFIKGNDTVFIFTHSENILLRLRRRTLEGILKPGDVEINILAEDDRYCMESGTIDEEGTLSDFVDGFFDSIWTDIMEMDKFRKERKGERK